MDLGNEDKKEIYTTMLGFLVFVAGLMVMSFTDTRSIRRGDQFSGI